MKFKEKLGKEMLICDGAMGTLLIENGLKAGELPEMWNIEHPDILYKIHKQYVDAGADIISANTFGANRLKLDGTGHSVEEIITVVIALQIQKINFRMHTDRISHRVARHGRHAPCIK